MILYNKYIPNKAFGQYFLRDKNIINQIIKFIQPNKQDCLIEIGPGLAALTKPIVNYVDHLFVIEIDQRFFVFLKKMNFYNKLSIIKQNVMNFNFEKIFIQKKKKLRIFGNIPYNISVKLILSLIKFKKIIFDLNFMIQKEVAQRLIALPNTKFYGRLSIIVQCYYDIIFGFNIEPRAFFPVPKVDSSFVNIKPKILPLYSYNKIFWLSKITLLAFQKRRKILKNSLSALFKEKDLLNLNIDPNLRAENLSVYEYCKLADCLLENNS